MYRAVLCFALAILSVNYAVADGIATYFESSANQKPRSNAGLSVESDRLRVKADVALQAPDKKTRIIPNLSSAFTIAKHLDIETHVNLAEWTTGADPTIDTRLHFRSLGPFFEELEGRIWRSPDGLSRQILKLGFYQTLSDATSLTPVTITGRAIYETTNGPDLLLPGDGTDARRVGLETVVAGLMSPFFAGHNAFSLRVDRVSGARPENASSLAYDQSWTMRNFTKLGFNLKVLRAAQSAANDLEPSLGFTWRTEF